MQRTPYASLGLEDEPGWPEGEGPYLFLIEESGPLERKLLEGWIARHQPPGIPAGSVQTATLPQTRRQRRRRKTDPRLEAFLASDSDPTLIPMRVIWLPNQREGRREVGWRDVLSFGDPRDPDPVRQHVIYRSRPDRVRILRAAPARASELRSSWEESHSRRQHEGTSLADFTALRAWLALERAEREFRGNRYKVPKFPRESLMARPPFARGVANLAQEAGASYEQMGARTKRYVREIAATHSPFVIDLVTGGFRWLIGKAYVEIHYDELEFDALYTMSQQYPLVFLPSHKSNFDHLILQYVLYQNRLPPNHTAGGINMNFFPVGPVLRRSGVFFIRREFRDNEPYKFVLRQYIDYLLEKRFPLEWYIEGGRSRSGKLRAPRYGMLAYVVESFQRGAADDVVMIPVSIAYDQIQDVGSYAAEQSGAAKQRESFGWMVKVIRSLRRRYGNAHLRFGAPVSLRTYLAEHDGEVEAADERRSPGIPKLAFEISVRLNEVTPITPISLVTLALLSAHGRSLSVAETIDVLAPYLDYVERRGLPVTEKLDLDNTHGVQRVLDALETHEVVARFEGVTDSVYRIGPEQHLAAAYYRNTIVHHFVTTAIAEMAVIAHHDAETVAPKDIVDEAIRLRNLLKFEFFFAPTDQFVDQIRAELADHDPDWRGRLERGEISELLDAFDPFVSHTVLRPFVEAYQVVGDLIGSKADAAMIDRKDLSNEAAKLGEQYYLQARIENRDAVNRVLFDSAIRLADNLRLLDPGPDVEDGRRQYAETIREVLARLDAIATLSAAQEAGLF